MLEFARRKMTSRGNFEGKLPAVSLPARGSQQRQLTRAHAGVQRVEGWVRHTLCHTEVSVGASTAALAQL